MGWIMNNKLTSSKILEECCNWGEEIRDKERGREEEKASVIPLGIKVGI